MFKLTNLEKTALLKKAGITSSLTAGAKIDMKEMQIPYDPEKSPEGDWKDQKEWGGFFATGGWRGFKGSNITYKIALDDRQFIILVKERNYFNDSSFTADEYKHVNCTCCGKFYYIFQTEGEDLDNLRTEYVKLLELLSSGKKHLPEAVSIFKKEAATFFNDEDALKIMQI